MKELAAAVTIFAALSMLVPAGCGSSSTGTASSGTPSTDRPSLDVPAANSLGVPDYASSSNWLALPHETTKQVDIFYLSDTTYQKAGPGSPNIGPINDPGMIQGARSMFSRTATTFETVADIYAPLNRQIDSQYKSTLPISEQLTLEAGIPTSDAVSAFDYYIQHLNKGRPFILAGHSQGSNLIANILSGYMKEHPELYRRMVASYVIGFSITSDYLAQNPQLRFAEGPDDTGVIISYNTEAPVMHATNPVTMPGGIAINPITWTRSGDPASAARSLGGISIDPQTGYAMLDVSGQPVKVEQYADAQINLQRGVVICSTANPSQLAPGNPAVLAGIYHPYDYPFYYYDIRANAENRVARYLKKD